MTVFLMGDFNTNFAEQKPDRSLLRSKMVKTEKIAKIVEGPVETRTGWQNGELKSIDHIFAKGNAIVLNHQVVTSPPNVFPSDHRPVLVDVEIH
jgi:endonuclease/exonuclease/phosphatase family metal-dependent hydrolase